MDENTTPRLAYRWATVALVIFIIVLLGLLGWCWWHPKDEHTVPTSPTGMGACTNGAENEAPAGFTFYENEALGYRFAYPMSWGSVTVTTTPVGSESGNYVMGRFSANENVRFGGNAIDYTVNGRDGISTDLPGYLKASGAFYKVELWKFNAGGTVEPRDDLHLLEPPYEEKVGCNATALLRQVEASELSSVGPATLALFNLKPGSVYYGVNFVLNHPTPGLADEFDKVVRSFQLY
jgi:hypothetical protein